MSTIPPFKPKLTKDRVFQLMSGEVMMPDGSQPNVAVLAVRGYRRDTMGEVGVNDAGIYDDAMFLVVGQDMFPFNANVDPSVFGWNPSLNKPYANLKVGLWYFIKGHHKAIARAFRQPDEEEADEKGIPNNGHFTVVRNDGHGHSYEESGYFAINIHPGGYYGTSSWGCQTLPPETDHWDEFRDRAYAGLTFFRQPMLPYLLINGPVS